MHLVRKLALATLFSGVAVAASAAPLFYDELLQGDVPESSTIASFNLDSGVNVVQGTLRSEVVIDSFGKQQLLVDFDPFELVLPAGLRVDGFTANLKYVGSTSNAGQLTLSWFAAVPSGSAVYQSCFEFVATFNPNCTISSTGGPVFAGIPDQAASYRIEQGYALGYYDVNQPLGGLFTYSLVAVVSSVPEPSQLLLALFGGALVMVRRHGLLAGGRLARKAVTWSC